MKKKTSKMSLSLFSSLSFARATNFFYTITITKFVDRVQERNHLVALRVFILRVRPPAQCKHLHYLNNVKETISLVVHEQKTTTADTLP